MRVKQISIFLENKRGRLAAVTRLLADTKINIRALSIADTTDFGVLRLIVDQPDLAYQVLKKNDFTVSETEVIAVEMPDKPGGLAKVLEILDQHNINLEYLYAFYGQSGHEALNIFRVEQIDEAIQVLGEHHIKLLPGDAVYAL
ncbi:ACT domain-containing protein [Dehalobacterium formicoaceticum]|uniref:ACT domain-containing protein n=1 Tax=Dehalobacterium formicoaceticum TaxID=51515 RepID=UPI000B7F6311|nr:ACT domain-containing protein [Dehalobacterium formicoaceticum]